MGGAGEQPGASGDNGKEMHHLNDRAVDKMNSLCLGFGLVLFLYFILTDEFLLDDTGNTCWTISTASTGNTQSTLASMMCGVEPGWFEILHFTPRHCFCCLYEFYLL